MRLLVALPALSFLGLLVSSCGGGNAASQLATPPEFNPKDQSKCSVAKSQLRPLIIEWPSVDRQQLESKVQQGLVVVRYQGCEMTVLDRCSVPARYAYRGTTIAQDKVVMKNEDDLYANLPVGAASLEAMLQRSGQLTVDMDLVGRYEAEKPSVRPDELQGECAGATHVVSALAVGAFDFYAGGQAQVGGGVGVGNVGMGGHSQADRESLTKNGDPDACSKATPGDKVPPAQCGALIRLEVVPLVSLSPSCPAGMTALPGGGFKMGERGDMVTVQPFCMNLTDVTAQAYAVCEGHGLCKADHPAQVTKDGTSFTPDARCNEGVPGRWNHPMNCVDWTQATSYCRAQGARLPTEEEWEWAARGGVEGRTYPWGAAEPASQLCWHRLGAQESTCAVATFPEGDGQGGIHDLAGNVLQWVGDAGGRGVRGSTWVDMDASFVHITLRRPQPDAALRYFTLGFRCAK